VEDETLPQDGRTKRPLLPAVANQHFRTHALFPETGYRNTLDLLRMQAIPLTTRKADDRQQQPAGGGVAAKE